MKKSPSLKASSIQQGILESIARQVTSTVREVERTKLILTMLTGNSGSFVSIGLVCSNGKSDIRAKPKIMLLLRQPAHS